MRGFEITEKKIPEFLLVFHMNLNGVKLVYISFIGEVKISQMFIHVSPAPIFNFWCLSLRYLAYLEPMSISWNAEISVLPYWAAIWYGVCPSGVNFFTLQQVYFRTWKYTRCRTKRQNSLYTSSGVFSELLWNFYF